MSSILSSLGALFSGVLSMIQTISLCIVGGTVGSGSTAVTYDGHPILLLFILVPLVGIGVGMFRRLLNVN